MRRLLATIALVSLLALGGIAGAPAAVAQSGEQAPTTAPEPGGDMIPEPNSGSEPDDAGDRGGSLQSVLFVGIIGGIAVMGWLVVRQSRKARAERGF